MEAKEELQQTQSASGGSAGRHNDDHDVGISGFLSLVRKLLAQEYIAVHLAYK